MSDPFTQGEEEIAFFLEFGLTLAMWATIEDSLRRLVIGGIPLESNRNAISVGFFSIEGAKPKRDFAEAVIARLLPEVGGTPAMAADWANLIDRIRAATTYRNKLAHWGVGVFPRSRPGRRYALGPFVVPKIRKPTNTNLPRDGSLCLRDIVKIRLEFIALSYALENFLHRLAKQPEPYPKDAERPDNPPPTAKLRLRIRAELAHLLQPSEKKS